MLMLLHSRFFSFTMSKLNAGIPIFTGTNWAFWWLAMSAYNQAFGHTWVLLVSKPLSLKIIADVEEINYWIKWSTSNDSIIGLIKIQLLEAIRAKFSTQKIAKGLITVLQKEYASFSIAKALLSSKSCLTCRFHCHRILLQVFLRSRLFSPTSKR